MNGKDSAYSLYSENKFESTTHDGLTKLEYTAIQAMSAMLSNGKYTNGETVFENARVIAAKAVTYAQALEKELSNT